MALITCDILVIGGGIIGLNLAIEARKRRPDARVILLEKEDRLAAHASGRNSGVIHSGLYYDPSTLKARLTREGNRRMKTFCKDRDLPLNCCGKVVVCRTPSEHQSLDLLIDRARRNNVEIKEVSARELHEIEPRAKTLDRALWCPTTASVDPVAVTQAFGTAARQEGVEIWIGTAYLRSKDGLVKTDRTRISPGYVINAAGLHTDRVARDFGFGQDLRVLPFKGLYLRSSEPNGSFRTHIYPVPNLERTFLGVHVTVTSDGGATLGPTATPAFWREHYRGLENFRAGELFQILGRQARLFLRDEFDFRSLAVDELKKHCRSVLVERGSTLAKGIHAQNWTEWRRPGVRAQLLNIREDRLVMDFHLEGDEDSFHVLNTISPGFTCAIPFREYCWDQIQELRG